MPTRPTVKTLSGNSVEILNAIRNNATNNYRDYVPLATPNAESIREIGAIIMDYPALQNEFLSALVNRIGRVLVTSRMYSNPLSVFKKGMLDYGETVEEIFVNLAKPFQYDPDTSVTTQYQRVIPDVRSAFHVMNYQKFYKVTISDDQLRQAFLSWDGITDLIARIVDSMYTAANYDEQQVTLYMLAKSILNGRIYPVEISAVSSENMKSITSTLKGISNDMEFMSTIYNPAGVYTHSAKDRQYLLINAMFDATMDVEVLASAFNMSKAEFLRHRVMIPSFQNLDVQRLNPLFAGDPTYTEIDSDELTALTAIPAVLVDRDWFMIFDNLNKFTEKYNGEGLYWNYWYHQWKTFSVSPFANAAMFIPGTPGVTSVTVNPNAATLSEGGSIQLTATVETTNFAPQEVNWTIQSMTGGADGDVTVSASGFVQVSASATATAAVIRATSVYDSTKYGECTITIG